MNDNSLMLGITNLKRTVSCWEEDVSKTEDIRQSRLGTRNLATWMAMSMKDLVVKNRIHTSVGARGRNELSSSALGEDCMAGGHSRDS